ncbi:putative eka-like protein [Golovinomyces cichoracearum]|uniref:Putative eka-like protein n=1 Tax=Golovinomyces cichoracearum TaxID=62708 RepID=A0A420I1K2_9PEZI|nr:putative eka-like protein [Golovinomyces cichoracearum]
MRERRSLLVLIFPPPNIQKQNSSVSMNMKNYLNEQATLFQTRLREAEVILGRFYDTIETITDPQFRAATEVAVSGLKDQLNAILWGQGSEKTPKTPLNTPPTTTNTRPKVPTTHPAAQLSYVSAPNNLKAVPKQSQAKEIANPVVPMPPPAQESWTEVVRRNKPKATTNRTQQNTTEKLVTKPTQPAEIPKQAAPKPDDRLFLRLGKNYSWRRMSPHYVKLSLA